MHPVAADPLVRAGLHRLAQRGFTIALDDFIPDGPAEPLLDLAHIVKLDLLATPVGILEALLPRLRRRGLKLLAEKIETRDQQQWCRSRGFDYYQGYFLSQPKVIPGRHVATAQPAVLALIARINDPRATLEEIEAVIARDAALSYRLLRYLNSAFFSLACKVDTLKRAVLYLGQDHLRAWATLMVLAGQADYGVELARTALVRAVMCRELARQQDVASPQGAFTVGLLSILDALLETPMAQVLPCLPLSEEVADALGRRRGALGRYLALALAYERGDWERVEHYSDDDTAAGDAYLAALQEAEATFAATEQ